MTNFIVLYLESKEMNVDSCFVCRRNRFIDFIFNIQFFVLNICQMFLTGKSLMKVLSH